MIIATDFRQRYPWCIGCYAVGVHTPTQVVDHIVPHKKDKAKFWDPLNWQPSCEWHHNAIKPLLEARYHQGRLRADELKLDSRPAIALTKKRMRMPIGADGFPIANATTI